MSRSEIVDIVSLTPAQHEAVKAIYLEAFDAPWEMPADRLADFAHTHTSQGLAGRALALLNGGAVAGLALAGYLTRSNFFDLKYLAVDPHRRSQGLGSILLTAVVAAGETIARAAGRDGCRGTLLEVEIPDSPPPDADRRLRHRRIAFYERHGALLTGVPFARPPDAPPEQPDWETMVVPGRCWDGALSNALRRELGLALMVEGYGNDPTAPWLSDYLDKLAPPDAHA